MSKVEQFGLVQVILSVITFGFYAMVSAIIASRTKDPSVKRGDRVMCMNCKSRWVYEGQQHPGS